MSISGNYNMEEREVKIVEYLFQKENIDFLSVEKIKEDRDMADVRVNFKNGASITVEVKEERYKNRFEKYKDLGIDFISAFDFKDKSKPITGLQSPKMLNTFINNIDVKKLGKIYYSKADLWLFFVVDGKKLIWYGFFDGKGIKSDEFRSYLKTSCKFSANKKSNYKLKDSAQSAVFFINSQNPKLLKHKVDLKDYLSDII